MHTGTRGYLGTRLDYLKENADRLSEKETVRLVAAFLRVSDGETGVLDIDSLPRTDIDELWSLVNDIATGDE
jgi:hypothetical protein